MAKCKGNGVVPVTPRSTLTVKASGEFYVQAHDKGGLLEMMGPPNSTARFLRVSVPTGCTHMHIKCKPSIQWMTTETLYNDQEKPDPRPKEIPINAKRPESLEDMVQRFVQTAVSDQAEQKGQETFEEANDFDIEDPFDFDAPDSAYTELEPEELDIEAPPPNPEAEKALETATQTKEPPASCPAASVGDSDPPVPAEATP